MVIEKWIETSSNKPSLSFGLLNVELLQKWSSLNQAIIDTSSFSIKTYSHTQGLLSFPEGWMARSFGDFSSSSPLLPPLHSFACEANKSYQITGKQQTFSEIKPNVHDQLININQYIHQTKLSHIENQHVECIQWNLFAEESICFFFFRSGFAPNSSWSKDFSSCRNLFVFW